MSLMFLSMVFHARRRQQAIAVAERLAGERAADLERQKAFLSDASHELKTPITIARGSIDVLRRTHAPSPVDIDETLAIASAELARMGRLIERLLLLASADASKVVPMPHGRAASSSTRCAHAGRCSETARSDWRPTASGTVPLDRDQAMLAVDAAIENASSTRSREARIELELARGRRAPRHRDQGLRARDLAGRTTAPLRALLSPRSRPQPPARRCRPRARDRRRDRRRPRRQGVGPKRARRGNRVSLSFPGYVPGVAQDVAAAAHRVDVDERAELAT